MYIKRNYSFWMTFRWSKKPFVIGTIYGTILCLCHSVLDIHPELPWEPISVIGIAVAFYLGFKNNSSYDRTWEARKIWGGIVNNSRSFGAQVVSFVHGDDAVAIRKELIYRHTAWITALRYQLRLPREWEHTEDRVRKLYSPSVVEMNSELDKELCKYLHQEFPVPPTVCIHSPLAHGGLLWSASIRHHRCVSRVQRTDVLDLSVHGGTDHVDLLSDGKDR